MKYVVTLRDKTYEVEVEEGEAMILDEYEAKAPVSSIPATTTSTSVEKAAIPSSVAPSTPTPSGSVSGTTVEAPLPGNVLSIKVKVGDTVQEGDVLLLIEAMKMENEVMAPHDGTVQQINVDTGQMVNTGDALVII